MSVTPTCRVCEGSEAKTLFRKNEVPYFCCTACGFIFAETPRNPNLDNALSDYEPAYLEFFDDAPDDDLNFSSLLAPIRRLRPALSGPVLDVGAGSGKFVRHLRAQGLEAFGVEPARPIFERFLAREEGFFQGTLGEVRESLPHSRFEAIFIVDVIEHVERPGELLAQAAALLAPGGLLVVTTPDVGSPMPRLIGKRWHHYNRYHLGLFSRASLKNLATRHGLRELHFARIGRRRSLGYIARYLADFVGGARIPIPAGLARVGIPINLYDTMYVYLERD